VSPHISHATMTARSSTSGIEGAKLQPVSGTPKRSAAAVWVIGDSFRVVSGPFLTCTKSNKVS
jgi:hypothetical protein